MTFHPTHQYTPDLMQIEEVTRLTVDDVEYVVYKELDGNVEICPAEWFAFSVKAIAK